MEEQQVCYGHREVVVRAVLKKKMIKCNENPSLSLGTVPFHLQLHSIDGIQHPAHCAVTPTHQHPDAAGGQQGAQLEGFGGSQLRKVKHLGGKPRHKIGLSPI